MKRLILCVLAILLLTPTVHADEATLAKESEAYVKATAPDKPTSPQLIIDKVNEACGILQAEGAAAYPKFKGKGSKFLFEGTYIWIHSVDESEMLMHPIKNKLVGKKLIGLKDKTGKRFFSVMSKVVNESGAGWVSYLWPKPGSKEYSKKISYVKKCIMANKREVVIGCGLYSYSEDDLKKLTIN